MTDTLIRLRRPPFGRHGKRVVALLCAYEVVALHTPLPTITAIVRQFPLLGVLLLALLAHHWFIELEEELAWKLIELENSLQAGS
jgi:hypothetical protein